MKLLRELPINTPKTKRRNPTNKQKDTEKIIRTFLKHIDNYLQITMNILQKIEQKQITYSDGLKLLELLEKIKSRLLKKDTLTHLECRTITYLQ